MSKINCLSLKLIRVAKVHEKLPDLLTATYNPNNAEYRLTCLKVLDLQDSEFKLLPPEIGDLKQLINLQLPINNLRFLPPEICNLKQLIALELSENNFRSLPSEIGSLSRLKCLYVRDNLLTYIPYEIKKLALECFETDGNNFEELKN